MFKNMKKDEASASSKEKLPWRQVLDNVANAELFGYKSREDRDPWRKYLQKADDIMKKPRKAIPKEIVNAILAGDLTEVDTDKIPTAQPKVAVFVSSTFTDTKAERNQLMKDVYPFIRSVSRRLGVDFGTVDMRWGVTEESTNDHSTVDMCVGEIHRCIQNSSGPAFLCFLSHKYGYRPIPASIDQSEFEELIGFLKKNNKMDDLIDSFYKLDTNAVPPEYVLRPKSNDDKNWWTDVENIQDLFREAAVGCYGISDKRCEKYHISVTEREIHEGVFENPKSEDQASVIRRELAECMSEFHIDRKIVDLKEGKVDEYAKTKLTELRDSKLPKSFSKEHIKDIQYKAPTSEQCCAYLREICDYVCKSLIDNIMSTYEERLHVVDDVEFHEILRHRNLANDKANLFVGKEKEIGQICQYVNSKDTKPMVVHGVSGCGKTALMAVASRKVKSSLPNAVVVMRFLGTTGQSGAARSMLQSVATQITRAYKKDVSNIPSSYKELVKYFRTCMAFATAEIPLIIFLDSLDQLSNEDFGLNLKWLSLQEELPDNVKLIVSSLPTNCLEILKNNLSESRFICVKPLDMSEGPEIIDLMLRTQKRTVTKQQKDIILQGFAHCPLPLYLRLTVDLALKWHSYDSTTSSDISEDMSGLITMLFERLESRFGEMFVHRALSYITAAKFGLSLNELEDVLSCDDEVLDSIFQWWIPPIRRIPSMLWARVRNELQSYLVEKGTDGVAAYGWFHRQFWETAEKRYLLNTFGSESGPFKNKAHAAIADYFDGIWEMGKPYKNTKKDKNAATKIEDRKVQKQPIVVGGDRVTGRQLNKRKLSELPYHLIQLKEWNRFEKLVTSLEYIEAKFEAGMGYTCLSELIDAARDSDVEIIRKLTRFTGSNISFLIRETESVYQLAYQQSNKNPVRKLLDALDGKDLPKTLVTNKDEQDVDDPCEMTLQGHTETLRCCDFSPKGDLILSASDDKSMRIWDATTGAELVTVTGLPDPVFPGENEPQTLMLHPVNPGCFNRTGDKIASGTEQGEVKLWDISGVETKSVSTQNKAVCYIKFSPDNKSIATVFKNSVVSIWKADDLSLVASINTSWGEATGLDFFHDGTMLAASSTYGLVLISMRDFSVQWKQNDSCYCLCCKFYPGDANIYTGGSDSTVSIWDRHAGNVLDKVRGHTAWIWSVQFTKDGKFMFTGSSDRTMKVWQNHGNGWSMLIAVGGHSHRVSMVSILPGREDKLVTSSLDRSLKVWDVHTLLKGEVPAVGGLFYNICVTSETGKYVVVSQGWSRFCILLNAQDMTSLGSTSNHAGFIKKAKFTQDESILVMVDHGHSGNYSAGAEKNAVVRVVSIPSLDIVCDLKVASPITFSLNNDFILVVNVNGMLHLFDRSSYTEVHTWNCGLEGGDLVVSISPVSNKVAVSLEQTTQIWNVKGKSSTKIEELPNHGESVYVSNFSPDGNFLVLGMNSGKLHVWDTAKAKASNLVVLAKHASYVKDIKFSKTGNSMVTSAGLSMRVWDVKKQMALKCVYYSPVNCAGFLEENLVLAGEATGTFKHLAF